ncbi:MAG: hypothetical protein IJU41_00470 [Clostridia bacterium]|nr:hypothetical protein [Clostridia bacterium]
MFEIIWTDRESMYNQTQDCFKQIKDIEEFVTFQNKLYETATDDICFGDGQIDGLAYSPDHSVLTVYICCYIDKIIDEKQIKEAHYVIDFFEPEIRYFDIEFNTHWIDEVLIQKNGDGKYSISFGTGECDFRYSYAKVNRCWMQ